MSNEQMQMVKLLHFAKSTYRLLDALSAILEEPGIKIPSSLRQAGVEACADWMDETPPMSELSDMIAMPILTEQEYQHILAALNFWMEETPPMSEFKEFFQTTLPLGFEEIEALLKRLKMVRQQETTGKEDR
jgi:hypothetical protein